MTTTSSPDPIVVYTIRDPHTLACPLCTFTIDVPDVPVSDALGAVFGMSGDTFARVQAERTAGSVSREMADHLGDHPVLDWLPRIGPEPTPPGEVDAAGRPTCSLCKRPRTPVDTLDYNPLHAITGQPVGWYSGEDGEICGPCMTKTLRNQ